MLTILDIVLFVIIFVLLIIIGINIAIYIQNAKQLASCKTQLTAKTQLPYSELPSALDYGGLSRITLEEQQKIRENIASYSKSRDQYSPEVCAKIKADIEELKKSSQEKEDYLRKLYTIIGDSPSRDNYLTCAGATPEQLKDFKNNPYEPQTPESTGENIPRAEPGSIQGMYKKPIKQFTNQPLNQPLNQPSNQPIEPRYRLAPPDITRL